MQDEPQDRARETAPTESAHRLPEPTPDPLLPARLSAFAPPDEVAETKTRERLRAMTPKALRTRRQRIDRRLQELGLSVGEPALKIPSVRGTGQVDLDRILRKIDALDRAREEVDLERTADRKNANLLQQLAQDVEWLADTFTAREIRTRRNLLTSELGLALCASDMRVLEEYAPHVRRLLAEHVDTARKIDELFVQAKLVDEEFESRAAIGMADEPPKQIEQVLSRALDSVDGVSTRVGDVLVDFGKTAAKNAAVGGGQAAWALARGAAKGAWALGTRRLRSAAGRDEGEAEGDDVVEAEAVRAEVLAPRALPATASGPAPQEIPDLIRKLAKLREEGILSDREFQTKKAELLSRL